MLSRDLFSNIVDVLFDIWLAEIELVKDRLN